MYPAQAGMVVSAYEMLNWMKEKGQITELSNIIPLPYLAAAVCSIASHPLDNIRKLVMLSASGNPGRYTSMKPSTFLASLFRTESIFKICYPGFTLSFVRNAVWLSLIYGRHSDAYKQLEHS